MSAGPPATTIRVIPLVSEQRPRLEAAEAAFLGDHPDLFGNPHSISPTPAASTRRVERARASMLDYLSAASDE
jgi:hypothetical protein